VTLVNHNVTILVRERERERERWWGLGAKGQPRPNKAESKLFKHTRFHNLCDFQYNLS